MLGNARKWQTSRLLVKDNNKESNITQRCLQLNLSFRNGTISNVLFSFSKLKRLHQIHFFGYRYLWALALRAAPLQATSSQNWYLYSLWICSSVAILYPLLFGVGGHMSKDFPPAQNDKLVRLIYVCHGPFQFHS